MIAGFYPATCVGIAIALLTLPICFPEAIVDDLPRGDMLSRAVSWTGVIFVAVLVAAGISLTLARAL